jgi:hypothetical protein
MKAADGHEVQQVSLMDFDGELVHRSSRERGWDAWVIPTILARAGSLLELSNSAGHNR